jgi:uncharacterized protein YcbK (DUF882 family)
MRRRSILQMLAGAVAFPRVGHAVAVAPTRSRRLRLLNAHTGEVFDGPYRDANGPMPVAMQDLSAFMRDFHSGAEISIDVAVMDFLAAIMDEIGENKATILSAYRTPETNAMLAKTTFGVAENSQHMYGRALDVFFGSKMSVAVQVARAMQRGGIGWYPGSNFMHIDSGPVRNWDLMETGLKSLVLPDERRPSPGLLIAEDTGRLLPTVARQHIPLTTQQLLERMR